MTIHTIEKPQGRFAATAADWLCLAAAPAFAIMALLTGVLGGGPPDMSCMAAQDGLRLSGMIWMYMLMSAFHSAPWLKLISRRRNAAQSRSGVRQIGPESTDRTQLA